MKSAVCCDICYSNEEAKKVEANYSLLRCTMSRKFLQLHYNKVVHEGIRDTKYKYFKNGNNEFIYCSPSHSREPDTFDDFSMHQEFLFSNSLKDLKNTSCGVGDFVAMD